MNPICRIFEKIKDLRAVKGAYFINSSCSPILVGRHLFSISCLLGDYFSAFGLSERSSAGPTNYFSAFGLSERSSAGPTNYFSAFGLSERSSAGPTGYFSAFGLSERSSAGPTGYFSVPNPKTALYPKLLRRPHPPTKTPSLGFYRVFGWFGFGWLEKFKFGTLYHFVPLGFYPVFSKIGICGKRKLQSV